MNWKIVETTWNYLHLVCDTHQIYILAGKNGVTSYVTNITPKDSDAVAVFDYNKTAIDAAVIRTALAEAELKILKGEI